ncbi:ABC transporter permease [Nibrella saemangeumensis]|uniref:ABC transporter permease n=1 Tax=Nibrella saemangeumensis TaxID=1084526 RepID=A0ABP8MB73_9BACT
MLRNYFKIAFRSLWKNKVFAGINMAGLALGMAACLLILEYISFERSVNQFHTNLPHLYRVVFQSKSGNASDFVAPGVAPLVKEQFGEIATFCRTAGGIVHGIVTAGDAGTGKSFREGDSDITMVEGTFFELFSFPIVAGSGESLKQPYTVAISESYAKKYFGAGEALGKMLTLNNQFGKVAYKVTAVYKDFPENSDFRYNLLFSLQTLTIPANLNGNGWADLNGLESAFATAFVQLQPGVDYRMLEDKINTFKNKLKPESADMSIRLQPMRYIHLAPSLNDPYPTTGNLKFIYLLGGIALLILAIAWFNYINLSTASSLKRAKEVGVRKVIGAGRWQLIRQFLSESLVLNAFGLVLALVLVSVLQEPFNQLVGKSLSVSVLGQDSLWMAGLLALVFGSVLSGGYVAFALSSFEPMQTLKGVFARSGRGVLLRQALVVFQFSISIALIASTVVLYQQLQYMQNKDLGVKLDQLLVIRGPEMGKDESFKQRSTAFQQQIQQLSFIRDFCATSSVPSKWYNFNAEGITRQNPRPGDEKKSYAIASVDHRFVSTYGLTLLAGQNITAAMCTLGWNEVQHVLLNETAVRQLGFASPAEAVGKKLMWGHDYEIVGVVKDYHHQSVRQAIDPIIFYPQFSDYYMTVRLTSDRIQEKMGQLEQLYKKQFPGNPYEYFFVDEVYHQQYQAEQQSGLLFTIASGLAILIACLGLFGLATFTAEQRTKEIGIRKVLGASVPSLVSMLSRDFLKLVFIAILIASPIAWYAVHSWLQDFAYKIDIEWWMFALAGLLAVSIALVTVSFQSVKAALVNPVKSLKAE